MKRFFRGAWALHSDIADMSHYLSAAIGLPGTNIMPTH